MINSSEGSFTRTYDAVDQVQSVAWPTGKIVTWVYDAIGQRSTRDISTGTVTYTYDAQGNLASLVNEQSERTTFSYDAVGRATRKQLANGTRTSMAYDAAGRETQITHFTSSNTPFSSFADTYNAAGNRIQRVNLDGDVTTWTYDSSSQVLSERYTDSLGTTITTFAYDAVGNRLVENNDSTITTSVYDAANRLETSEETAGITTYTYDKNGNQTSIEDPVSDITTYSWTYENQLAEIESPNGDLVTYTYAPVNKKSDELRLSKETDLEFTSYMWDDQNIILEQDEVSTVDAEYTVMPQAYGNLISQTRDAESSFYHFDPLGSTRELTDASETVTDSYLYSVFGKVKSSTGTTVNPYQWVGKEGYYHDTESGLYNLRNRFYGAGEGRFKSEDPIGFDAGDVNLYRYVGNNAATDTDPSGLQGHIEKRNKRKKGLAAYSQGFDALESIQCECFRSSMITLNTKTGETFQDVEWVRTRVPKGWTKEEACNTVCSHDNRHGWTGRWENANAQIDPEVDRREAKKCGNFKEGFLLGGANITVAFTFGYCGTESQQYYREMCPGVSDRVQAISVGAAGLARETVITITGLKAAQFAVQGSNIARATCVAVNSYDIYGAGEAAVALLQSESLTDALINAGFLSLSLIGINGTVRETAQSVQDLKRALKTGTYKLEVKLKGFKTSAPDANDVTKLDIDKNGKLTDADMEFLGELDGHRIHQAKDGSLWACSDCRKLSPDDGAGSCNSGGGNARKSLSDELDDIEQQLKDTTLSGKKKRELRKRRKEIKEKLGESTDGAPRAIDENLEGLDDPISDHLQGTGQLDEFDSANWSPFSGNDIRRRNLTRRQLLEEINAREASGDITEGEATRLRRLLAKYYEGRDLG
ncbi:RHS repeat domain-containing protein [Gimesia fumaroli]|uniref:tRNA3(Ser)-specific nuclease WapA n=1 Tax=Gimesia fumaroli TaxID=2527976 RepID=A0A518IGI5_9PLAN|nr:tRNA3(Ser)-specific nuclease WapA precursor [Gimesia fumaroli]